MCRLNGYSPLIVPAHAHYINRGWFQRKKPAHKLHWPRNKEFTGCSLRDFPKVWLFFSTLLDVQSFPANKLLFEIKGFMQIFQFQDNFTFRSHNPTNVFKKYIFSVSGAYTIRHKLNHELFCHVAVKKYMLIRLFSWKTFLQENKDLLQSFDDLR